MPAPIALVAVDQAAFHFDKLYSYLMPAELGAVSRGCRVMVPFGGGDRRRQGIVMALETTDTAEKLKPILAVLDREPLLSEEMLDLAVFMKERTFCTLFDAVRAMLPTGLYMKICPAYRPVARVVPEVLEGLTDEERRLYQRVCDMAAKSENGADRSRLLTVLGLSSDSDLPERLIRKNVLVRADEAFRMMGDATVRMVRLAVDPEELPDIMKLHKCTDKQKRVLKLLAEVGNASVKEVGYFTGTTSAVLSTLEKKRLVEYVEREVLRTPYEEQRLPQVVSTSLNPEQQAAYDGLLRQYESGQAACSLLFGVTGSGKTQVYMNLIDRVIADSRQVLVLVPEISLTPQTMQLFLDRYGRRVAVLHSGLAMGERMDEWKRIRRGEASIVVGTRSAVFAPCENLGLIVMDEEQEHTYKSESTPRYHARDIAKFRCARHKALLLLASATPSVESFYAAKAGRYSLHTMTSRYGDAQLPQVEVVDMREETDDREIFSGRLKQELRQCLEEGHQAILLLNRRGYNTFISCRSCGHVLTCPSCSISMTYHRANGRLVCHYCGHMQDLPDKCPECGSDKLRYSGLGTQRVEQELTQLFPDVPVLRMDTDTTMSRYAYERKFQEFAVGKYRIMVGTQMVAKGLDFPNVGLVGVLSADMSLYGDDFRSFETTFALLTQVIGRAGRRERTGKAVIQTYTPENYVIHLAGKQDYVGFYELEITARKMMKYPPFVDLCLFGFVGPQEAAVRGAAYRFLDLLRETVSGEYARLPVIALDPSPAAVSKVAGKYRYKLLIKSVNSSLLRKMVAGLLERFNRLPENRQVTVFADINPANVL